MQVTNKKKLIKKIFSYLFAFALFFNHSSLEADRSIKKDSKNTQGQNTKSDSNKIQSYSIFIEEDYTTSMILFRANDGFTYAEILQYGGYKWFKNVFKENEENQLIVSIQPSQYGKSEDMMSWFLEKYLLDTFTYRYEERGQDQVILFSSNDGINSIEGYVSRGQEFSLAATDSLVWYAGTFKPLKTVGDFKEVAKNNSVTFCKIINDNVLSSFYNSELKSDNVMSLLKREGFTCDKNNRLK